MEHLKVVEKQLVTPGTLLTDVTDVYKPGRGTIRSAEGIVSVFVGLVQLRKQFVNVVPLNGIYTPSVGDTVIGRVVERTVVKWIIDINSGYKGILRPQNAIDRGRDRGGRTGGRSRGPSRPRLSPEEEMTYFNLGDIVAAKIISFSRTSEPDLTTIGKGLGRLNGGIVITVPAPKVPRIIGRRGSMIKLLKDEIGCTISVAQNGRIWIRGKNREDELLAIRTIQKIDREAHTSGLTDRVKEYILEQRGGRD
ncbi:MAG: exosome complex RNA-binding protein Rrp4 [Promethearchaeota archaeon]